MTNVTEVWPAAEYADRVERSKSDILHENLAFAFRARRLPEFRWKGHPLKELRFAKVLERQWRFDFAFEKYMLAVEIEGMVCEQVTRRDGSKRVVLMGGHATPTGFKEDIEKYNAAVQLGWSVLRFHQAQIGNNEAVDMTMRVLYAKGWRP